MIHNKNHIKSLEIKNFKSIKKLSADCSRINIFIGEPNSGKSNILEALSLFSVPYIEKGTMRRSPPELWSTGHP